MAASRAALDAKATASLASKFRTWGSGLPSEVRTAVGCGFNIGKSLSGNPRSIRGMAKPTNQQTHDAGRHLVVAQALLQGHKAGLVGRTSYVEVNGKKAQVQVAAKGAWQVDDVDKYTASSVELVVLVDVTDGLREFYICPGDKLRADVRKRHEAYLASQGGTRPRNPGSKHAAIYPEHVRKWRNGWRRFI